MRRSCILLLTSIGCAGPAAYQTDWWQGPAPPDYRLEPRFPGIEHKFFNYVAYTHYITAKGLDVAAVEAKLDGIFEKYAARGGYRKTKRGRAILYQLDRRVPDFDIWTIAEKDGRTFVPADLGDTWLSVKARKPEANDQ